MIVWLMGSCLGWSCTVKASFTSRHGFSRCLIILIYKAPAEAGPTVNNSAGDGCGFLRPSVVGGQFSGFTGFKLRLSFFLLTSAQEGKTVGVDLGGVPDLVVLIDPLIVAQSTGDADLAALVEVLAEDLGELAEGNDLVPVGPGLAVTVFVAVGFVGGQGEGGDGEPGFGGPYFRSGAEVTNEGDGVAHLHRRHKEKVCESRWYSY